MTRETRPSYKLAFNINIYVCPIELKWDGKKLKYDMITKW